MSDETKTDETPAEFFSDEHRESHCAALAVEKNGYEQRAEVAKRDGEDVKAAKYSDRASQCQGELDRITGQAKKPSARAERR